MTEFSTSSLLEVEISRSSLRSARGTIQSELGNVTVDVNATASNQLNPQNNRLAGKERAMSRSLLTDQTAHLKQTTDHLAENLDLNRERNDLLRDILEAQEMTAREDGDGGRSITRSLGGGLGLAGAGLVVAGSLAGSLMSVNWGQTIGNAIPDIDIGPDDVISGGAGIAAGNLIADKAGISPDDVINAGATVGASDLIASTVGAADLVGEALPLGVASLVKEALPIKPGDLVKTALPIGTAALVASALPLGAAALVADALPIGVGALLADAFPIKPSDIINQGEGSSGEGSSGEGTGGGGGFPWAELIAGGTGGGLLGQAAKRIGLGGGLPNIKTPGVGGGGGLGMPIPLNPNSWSALEDLTGNDYLEDFGGNGNGGSSEGLKQMGYSVTAPMQSLVSAGGNDDGGGRNDLFSGGDTFDISNDLSIDASGKDAREVEKVVDRKLKDFERSLNKNLQGL